MPLSVHLVARASYVNALKNHLAPCGGQTFGNNYLTECLIRWDHG